MVPRKHVEAAEARHMKSGTKWCMCMVRNAAFCIMRLVVLQAAIDMVRSELDSHGDPQVSGATVMNTRMTTDRQTGRKWLVVVSQLRPLYSLRSWQVAAEALTHAAIHERCSRDNVSVVIVLL